MWYAALIEINHVKKSPNFLHSFRSWTLCNDKSFLGMVRSRAALLIIQEILFMTDRTRIWLD